MVVKGYKKRPSLRLRINLKWPESVFLVLTKRQAVSGDEIGCRQEVERPEHAQVASCSFFRSNWTTTDMGRDS